MEQVQEVKTGDVEIYEDDIIKHIALFCDRYGIDNEYDILPSQWNACLSYIYKNTFKDNREILVKPHTVSNSYDLDAVRKLLDIYIDLCYLHNQEVTIMGFSKMSGICRDTIHEWGNSNYRAYVYKDLQGNVIKDMPISQLKEGEYVKEPSTKASDIYHKLVSENEESLTCLLKDKRYNPMKILPILNRRHSWNLPGVSRESENRNAALTAADLPQLGQIDTQLLDGDSVR